MILTPTLILFVCVPSLEFLSIQEANHTFSHGAMTATEEAGSNFGEETAEDRSIKRSAVEENDQCAENEFCVRQFVDDINKEIENGVLNLLEVIDIIKTTKLPICLQIVELQVFSFNPKTQLCCNAIVNKTTDHEVCCGESVIDSQVQLCCDDHVINKGGTSDCCSNKVYNVSQEYCCNGTLYTNHGRQACCGSTVYDKSKGKCCSGVLYEVDTEVETDQKCCGDGLYKVNASICCGGQIFEDKKKEGGCCNGRRYSTRCFNCSNDIVLVEWYDPSIEMCRDGKIVKRETNEKANRSDESSLDVGKEDDASNKTIHGQGSRPREKASNSDIVYISIGVGSGIILLSLAGVKLYFSQRVRRLYCSSETFYLTDANVHDTTSLLTETRFGRPDINPHQNSDNTYNKEKSVQSQNLSASLFQDSESQTNETHRHPRRTIFGKPFDKVLVLNKRNNIVQGLFSDVRMTLPTSLTDKETVTVHWTSFSDIPSLNIKLGLGLCKKLASPVVEYSLPGQRRLKEHACIEMPIIGSENDVVVMYSESDEGLSPTLNSHEIPRRDKNNIDNGVYYEIQDGKVRIFTRHNSVYYCIQNHKRADLNFWGFVYGSFRKINREYAIGVSLYVADVLFKFRDYQPRMDKNEVGTQGRVQLKDFPINISTVARADNYLEAAFYIDDPRVVWEHRKYSRTNKCIYPEKSKFILQNIVRKCKDCNDWMPRDEFPQHVEWSLNTVGNRTPEDVFQFGIMLRTCQQDGRLIEDLDGIFVERLELRTEDRLPVQEHLYHEQIKYPIPEDGSHAAGALRPALLMAAPANLPRDTPAPELSSPCTSSQLPGIRQ